jgi:cysteine desulfurase
MSIYLDHSATVPMVEPAIRALTESLGAVGNASSLHTDGRNVRKGVEQARELIADLAGSQGSEIIFTASGTEANNLAIKGFYWKSGKNVIVTSAIEHAATVDPVQWLMEHEGAEWISIGVNSQGVIDLDQLQAVVDSRKDEIALISIMHSNNEVGSLQPIAEVVRIAGDIPVHTDASQSFGKIEFNFADLGVTAATLSGHKVGGPLGVGALIVKRGIDITPVLHGGGQERDIRSGTVNAPGAISFAAAAAFMKSESYEGVRSLRNTLWESIHAAFPDVTLNGSMENSLPGILNLTFPGVDNESLLVLLDMEGISVSTGSACSAGVHRPSHVLMAMGLSETAAMSSLRFSLGLATTQSEIDAVVAALATVLPRARAAFKG